MTNDPVAPPFILCENLVKIYSVDELEVVALQGLDLAVRKGEFLAIVGASGSGKSSLLNILGGLDRPSAGRVRVGHEELLKLGDVALARYRLTQVGFVWQQSSRNLLPYLTAQENVELPMLAAGITATAATQHAQELLTAVDLADRRRHRLAQLSGGQQQRVAIAVALANRPQLLLADEPTGEVDSATAGRIWQMLRDLSARYGLTTIIVTHDRAIAHEVDRVVSIRDGKTSTETVRQPPTSTALGAEPELAANAPQAEPRFAEWAVLDLAGRVQIPRDYLEQSGIQTRAIVELVEEGILLRATPDDAPAVNRTMLEKPANDAPLAENSDGQDLAPVYSTTWWRRLLGRQRRADLPPTPAPPVSDIGSPSGMDEISSYSNEPGVSPRLPMDESPLVQVAGLHRVYQVGGEAVAALRGIDLLIPRQQLVVFKGRSGSGKTTLLNLIGGLDQPTSGQVLLFGQDLRHLSDAERTQLRQERVGFVFQTFSLMPTFSALENVEMLLRVAQMDEAQRTARALACLTLVGLRRWADHRPFEMSGGQQQRLSIARALARRPELIIADEPTSNLDSETGRQVFRLFQHLVTVEGYTVLMASHDPMSEEYADRVYGLSDGKVVTG